MLRISIRELAGITLTVALYVLYDYEKATRRNLGIKLSDGDFIQAKEPEGIMLGGSS